MIAVRAIEHEGVLIGEVRLAHDGWVALHHEDGVTYMSKSYDDTSVGYDKCVAVLMETHAWFEKRRKEKDE